MTKLYKIVIFFFLLLAFLKAITCIDMYFDRVIWQERFVWIIVHMSWYWNRPWGKRIFILGFWGWRALEGVKKVGVRPRQRTIIFVIFLHLQKLWYNDRLQLAQGFPIGKHICNAFKSEAISHNSQSAKNLTTYLLSRAPLRFFSNGAAKIWQ